MLIGITGHTSGIGQALYKLYRERGYDVVGLSRTNGYNIQLQQKVLSRLEDCDVFINNAHAGFSQVDLLYKMYNLWGPDKHIVNIGSLLSTFPISPNKEDVLYRTEKVALEEMYRQLKYRDDGPMLTMIHPGAVITHGEDVGANVDEWASTVIQLLEINDNMRVSEFTLEPIIRVSDYVD